MLDNNVDARARRVLTEAGHECWTIENAGLGDAADDDVAVYAWDKNAVPVINDKAFAERLKSREVLGGNVLFGSCKDIRIVEYLSEHVTEIVVLLTKAPTQTERIVVFNELTAAIWHPPHLA